MPRRFISKDGFAVTAAGKAYFEPLIAGEAYPDYHRGMPRYTRFNRKYWCPNAAPPGRH